MQWESFVTRPSLGGAWLLDLSGGRFTEISETNFLILHSLFFLSVTVSFRVCVWMGEYSLPINAFLRKSNYFFFIRTCPHVTVSAYGGIVMVPF